MTIQFYLGAACSLAAFALSCCGVKAIKVGDYYWAALFFTHALTMAVGMGVGIGMELSRP
jgi:hypothetical protein